MATIEELKKLPGTQKQRDRLWELYITEKKLTLKQYREITGVWDKNQTLYKDTLKGNLVEDAVKIMGDKIVGIE